MAKLKKKIKKPRRIIFFFKKMFNGNSQKNISSSEESILFSSFLIQKLIKCTAYFHIFELSKLIKFWYCIL